MSKNNQLRYQLFEKKYASEFASLNYHWLEAFQLIEDEDRKYLDNPEAYIIDKGGQIIFLLAGDEVLATCALLHKNSDIVELAKFAVKPAAQGRGLGKALVQEAIKYAIKCKYKQMILVSSTKLVNALKLYENIGFQHKALPTDMEYETADIYMELELDNLLNISATDV